MKLIFGILFCFTTYLGMGQIYATNDGLVHFVSDAPLEIIEAKSDQMQGLIDLEKNVFAFKMYIKSFKGFNNPLQQVHFYENYMEANDFPIATFKGKLLELVQKGKGVYRAKGKLEIHGRSVERIIEVELDMIDGEIDYTSSFTVPLEDHDIELPQIVYQKIAEEIRVKVNGKMILRNE